MENSDSDLKGIIPERNDLVAVYQFLKAKANPEYVVIDMFILAKEVGLSYRINMNYFKLKKCMEILEELKLLEKEQVGQYGMVIRFQNTVKGKTKLENSSIYRRFQLLKMKIH
jgi:single-stranded-DNA-specific exonuclease